MSISTNQFKKIAIASAKIADDKKAESILLLDLHRIPGALSDFLLILSANSNVHLNSLRESIENALDKINLDPIHQDGTSSNHWAVLDYGGLIVHIFHHEARKFYSMERLWENAKEIFWQEKKPVKRHGTTGKSVATSTVKKCKLKIRKSKTKKNR